MAQRYTSRNTSVNARKLPKVYGILQKHGLLRESDRVFDYGCGKFAMFIKDKMSEIVKEWSGYDPYNQYDVLALLRAKNNPCDIGIMSNVINVIDDETAILHAVKEAKQCCNLLYITAYEGNKSGVGQVTKEDCWQWNRTTKDWVRFFHDHDVPVFMNHGMIALQKTI